MKPCRAMRFRTWKLSPTDKWKEDIWKMVLDAQGTNAAGFCNVLLLRKHPPGFGEQILADPGLENLQ
jgi:hypothetical protein